MDVTRRDALLGGLALALAPRVASAQTDVLEGPAFGSTWRLVCDAPDPAMLPRINRQIAVIDRAMSPYRANSAISRFNRAGVGEVVTVPGAMAQVVRAALRMNRETAGAFDPTTGPMVSRMGFGPITGQMGRVEDIELRGASLRKAAQGLTLDLCGIAKGFALDAVTDDLIAAGASDFLLEMGGEVRAVGTHPSGRPWQVAFADPMSPLFAAHTIVAPGPLALATSGHAANGLMGPVAVSHVIDPQSARPATGFAASVSVLAATGMEADALATALLAMGADGPAFAQDRGISAYFIAGPGQPAGRIFTGQFNAHIIA